MMEKADLLKAEKFAKNMVLAATEEGLTIKEICYAAEMAKEISENSIVEKGSIERTDFLSNHTVD